MIKAALVKNQTRFLIIHLLLHKYDCHDYRLNPGL